MNQATTIFTRADVLNAQLRQRPPDLGRIASVDLAARLRSLKVVAPAVGLERAEQPLGRDRLPDPVQAGERAFFLDEEHAGVFPGSIVQGHD